MKKPRPGFCPECVAGRHRLRLDQAAEFRKRWCRALTSSRFVAVHALEGQPRSCRRIASVTAVMGGQAPP